MGLSDEAQQALNTLKRLGIEVEAKPARRKLYVVSAPGASERERANIRDNINDALFHEQDNVIFVYDKPVTVQVIEMGPILPEEEKENPDDVLAVPSYRG